MTIVLNMKGGSEKERFFLVGTFGKTQKKSLNK